MTEPRKRPPGLAATYARVSTERQARSDKTSFDGQIRRYERVALDLGFTVNRDYVVKDPHSASNPEDRPKLEQLYTAPRSAFRYVLMDVVDRTTRAGVFDGKGFSPLQAAVP